MMKSKFILALLLLVMLFSASACTSAPGDAGSPSPDSSNTTIIDKYMEGNPISLPESIDKIVTLGPSYAEILVALGFGDKIVATDTYAANVVGIDPDISYLDMMAIDGEQIIALEPDIVFATEMTKVEGNDLLKVVSDAGICVVYMRANSSIEAIKDDILFMSSIMGAEPAGEEIVAGMESEIEQIKKIGDTISDKKSVYFEIEAAPFMYSFGSGVFLQELLEIIGATNIFADQNEWISVTDEAVLAADPDVILTSVNYLPEDPVDEIKSRPGWDALSAVQNGDVYYIDTDSSNRPSPNIIKALKEMSLAIYPEEFK